VRSLACLFLVAALGGAAKPPLSDPTGIAFDRQGNLWICNYAGRTVQEYSAVSIAASGTAKPVLTIRGIRGPNNVAFDRSGNLWVAEYDGGSVAEIRGGKVAVRLRFPRLAYAAPTSLAFDRSGTLWVTDRRADRLSAFSPAQLRSSGEKKPSRSIVVPGGPSSDNQSVAFDPAGRVWIVQYGLSRVLGFTRPGGSRLRTVPTPSKGPLNVTPGRDGRLWVTLADASEILAFEPKGAPATYTSTDFRNPHTIAFDASGRLWTTQYSDEILGFEPGAFEAAGSVTPSIVLRNP
jgi:DNA-binding beta-propeller fold protein YncE